MFETAIEVLVGLIQAGIIFAGAWGFCKFIEKIFKA